MATTKANQETTRGRNAGYETDPLNIIYSVNNVCPLSLNLVENCVIRSRNILFIHCLVL